jgi:phage recombination protein Bet
MSTELDLHPDVASAPTTLFYGYTRSQVELAKRTLMPPGASDDELHLFLATAQRMGLDPFAQQIRAIARTRYNSRTKEYEDFISIEPGIDGLRLVAERTHEIQAEYGPYWCGPDGKWVDVWLSEKPPAAAKFGVLRKGRTEPRFAVALWREYRQTKRGGDLTSMWENRPAGQLAKCAEALCKRAVFPHELGGIYTSEEMAQADNAPATVVDTTTGEIVDGRGILADGWDDLQVQNDVHSRLNVFLADNKLGGWFDRWLAARGWQRPFTAEQMTDVRRAVLDEVERRQQSDPGSSGPTGVAGDAAPVSSPGSGQTRPPTPAPPPEASTKAGRGEVESGDANARTGAAEAPPPPDAHQPPEEATPPASSGGTKRAGRGRGGSGKETASPPAGTTDPEQAELAQFEQQLAGDDPGKWTR